MRLTKMITLLLAGCLTFGALNSVAATRQTKAKTEMTTKANTKKISTKKVSVQKATAPKTSSEKTTAKKVETLSKSTKKLTAKTPKNSTKKVTQQAVKSSQKIAKKQEKTKTKTKTLSAQAKKSTKQAFQTGVASYYADKFNGNRTANGEIFRNSALTAAHRTLPFGTMVEVTNLRNGRKVVVKINDRGPYAYKRVIDLSKAAARKIGMLHSGVAKVKIARVKK